MAQFDQLPYAIDSQLQAARVLLRKYIGIRSMLLVSLWVLIVFWVGGLLDYLPVRIGASEMPRWLRATFLAAMGLGSFWILLRWSIPLWLKPIPDRSLALLLERLYPAFENSLVTTVELTGKDETEISNPAVHHAMLQRVRDSAVERMAGVSIVDVFNWQPIWALGTAATLGAIVTIVAAVGLPAWMGLWSQRLFALSDTLWPRVAELQADGVQLVFPSFSGQLAAERVMIPFRDGLVHVPDGAAVLLQVSANANAQRVPEVCTLYYRSDDGTRGRANLRRVGSPRDGWQQFTLDGSPLDGITEDLHLDVVGLDARLRDLEVRVVEPAVLSEMQLRCVYPRYLLDSLSSRPAQESLPYRAGLRIPEGTQVTLAGVSNTNLREVEYLVLQAEGAAVADPANPVEDSPAAANQPQSVTPDGKNFEIDLGVLRQNQMVEIRLLDNYGLSSDQILRYVINIVEDTPPEVESTLAGIGSSVTPIAQLPIRGSVADDHAIAQVQLELAVNESEPQALPLDLAADGQLASTIDLQKLTEAGWSFPLDSSLGLVVTARDQFDLDGEPHLGRGQPQQLAVVSADQLLVLLDRQELELRQRLELIIEELQQVDEALESLAIALATSETAAFPAGFRRPWQSVAGLPGLRLVSHPGAWPPGGVSQEADDNQADDSDADDSDDGPDSDAARTRRLAVLRAQQCLLQCDKSEQELAGVANRVDNIRLQLLNNRIDSYDRQERLRSSVHDPLIELLNTNYRGLSGQLGELQTAAMSGGGAEQVRRSQDALAIVLETLEQIKASMLDIESFNEIVDLVRGLLEDQERLLNETEAQQKARVLDFLR